MTRGLQRQSRERIASFLDTCKGFGGLLGKRPAEGQGPRHFAMLRFPSAAALSAVIRGVPVASALQQQALSEYEEILQVGSRSIPDGRRRKDAS
jgi:hypothetical protein